MNTNKRMTAIVLAIVIAGASLAACATHQANTDIDIPETTTAGEETTTVPETTAGLTVTNNTATEPETETFPADRTEEQETTTKKTSVTGTATTTKKSNTATTNRQTVTTTKRQTITTTKPVTATKKPVTTTKRQTANTTTTKPVTTTKPKPTTTTTKAAPSTPTKAQIDKIVSDARAYGESLGMGWNSSLTIDNSGWSSPPNSRNQTLKTMKDDVYYQIKKWAKIFKDEGGIDGAPAFKVVSKKLSDGNYEIYVLIG